ncbi:DUF6941 family protein [Ectopseudomonas khazarica]|uniref:DUF6941 family protein n=1 Tax=Ectopseudomonas khazarica TaxID=2502979 RepID=UPI00384BE34B
MNKFVSTVFCDDVRHEVGGKATYVGIYGGTMFVNSFPAEIPKLYLVATISVPIEQNLKNAKLVILQDSTTAAEIEVPPTPEVTEEELNDEVFGYSATYIICFSPLKASEESKIRVFLQEDGEPPLKAQGLSIKLTEENTQNE